MSSASGGPAVRVALDAMGGDHAPAACVQGALEALDDGVDVVLVGRRGELASRLAAAGRPDALEIVEADEVVAMDEEPALALRAKPDASIRMAARLVAARDAHALVSAGSTGATLAAALLELGRLEGVRRPAVAAVLPIRQGVVLVDAGASPDVQPAVLTSYAQMGAAYAEVRGVDRPRIGLLNVGEEPGKGNALAREAHDLLAGVEGFVGNIEPPAVLSGAVDVVVTDGFTGNVFLKTVEAGVRLAGAGGHDGPGAAILLGARGEVLVAHGAAGSAEIAAAVRTGARVASAELSDKIAKRLGGRTARPEEMAR